MERKITNSMLWNSRFMLFIMAILLVLSTIYHFNLISGLYFSDKLHVENYKKYSKKGSSLLFSYRGSVYDDTTKESNSLYIYVYPNKMTRRVRDSVLKNKLSDDEKLVTVKGFPASRKDVVVYNKIVGGEYCIMTNNLIYFITADGKDINQEKELLKLFWISGGDMTFRYYVGSLFYLFIGLFLLNLVVYIGWNKKFKEQTDKTIVNN